jgi:hypothetical protein
MGLSHVYRTPAAILFGIAAFGFGLACVTSWRAYQVQGARFVGGAGRHGFTTFDQVIGLALLTVICGVVCLSCLLLPRGGGEIPDLKLSSDDGSPNASPSWICPGCREPNPDNFEKCRKCQRERREVKT